MSKASKRLDSLDKLLVYQDGTQRSARVGLVDSHGVFCTMQDAEAPEYFAYSDQAALISELQEDKKRSDEIIAKLDEKLIDMERLVRDMASWLSEDVKSAMLKRMARILD
jgi:hypothetical protein